MTVRVHTYIYTHIQLYNIWAGVCQIMNYILVCCHVEKVETYFRTAVAKSLGSMKTDVGQQLVYIMSVKL
jgi:hypothetical protein